MTVLISILAFIVAVGLIVSVHEFGHFWVAKRLGVKVLRFSIGFGQPLFKRRAGRDDTEYVVAAIPLGGYVKMLDEREGSVAPEERHRAFNHKPVAVRFAIVAAGPVFNFLFAIAAYWLMFVSGEEGIRPVIGAVEPASIAARATLKPGDEIVAVGERQTPTWETASLALINEALEQGQVSVTVQTVAGDTQEQVLDLSDTRHLLDEGNLLQKLGIEPWQPALSPVVGKLIEEGPAARAGLKPQDRILSADGTAIKSWDQWVKWVQTRPNQRIQVEVERAGQVLTLPLTTEAQTVRGERVGRIGAYPFVDPAQVAAIQVSVRHGPLASVELALEKTWEMTTLTLRVLWRLVTGEASLKNISGPITIAEFAGVSAAIGLSAFLGALALFSVSIGILNLLPVPVLDGGHLLYYLIEAVKGKPLSEHAQAIGQRIGLVLLVGLMGLAFYNDIARLLG